MMAIATVMPPWCSNDASDATYDATRHAQPPQNPKTGYVWSSRARTSARAYVACVGTFATEIEEEPY